MVRARRWGFLWQFFSHKLLRWLTLPLMTVVLLSNLVLVADGVGYSLFFGVQVVFWVVATTCGNAGSELLRLPYGFVQLHAAALLGLVQHLRGERYVMWSPRKS